MSKASITDGVPGRESAFEVSEVPRSYLHEVIPVQAAYGRSPVQTS